MKTVKILIILGFVLMTSGCWNYRELNDMALVQAVGIDKEADGYQISVQIVNVKKQAKESNTEMESPVVVYEGKGKTLSEALNKIELQIPKELYIGHIKTVVVGEETAKLGIRDYLDFLLRDREVRKIYPFFIAKGSKAVDVLKVLTPIETLPSVNLVEMINTSQKTNGEVTNRAFDNVLMCLYTRGRHPGVPAVEIVGAVEEGEKLENISDSTPNARLSLTGPAVFKEDRLVGYLEDKEGLGYNIMRNMVNSSIITFPCDDAGNYGSVKMDKPKISTNTKIENGKPLGEVKLETTATIIEYNCKLNIKEPDNIKKIEKMVNREVKSILESAIITTQKKFGSDIIGFGENLYRNDYKNWLKFEDNWDETFSTMPYKIEVKTTINNTGDITIPAKEGGTSEKY